MGFFVDTIMSNNNNNPRDFFPSSSSPALSLSLAGIFRGAEEKSGDVEEKERTRPSEDTTEISSENSGPVRSRSLEDFIHNVDDDDNYDDDINDDIEDGKGKSAKKKRKKYHRHTAQQIREMEALFKESPHPDEKQRQQLSKQLDLHPRQVKFWFQNRRTQIKAIQERHENSLLKTELEKIKEENKSFREVIQKASCPNCGFASNNSDTTTVASTDEQQLKIENARLKTEVEKLRSMVAKYPPGTSSPSASCSEANTDQENKSSLDLYKGSHGIGKPKIIDIVDTALEELKNMANSGEPLWVTSVETGRQILNYDEYVKEFSCESSSSSHNRRSIEASRESGVVFLDLPRLLQCFMDVSQWEEVFSCMVSKAAVVDVICRGEGPNKDGIVQLMFAELQMLTPLVSTREVHFVRHCKQLSPEKWAIVDVSIDNIEDSIDTSLLKYRKRPSGCIIEDKNNGHCKVTWVEHLECQKGTVHSLYRTIVNSGLAFGAKHWMTTLQLQCERLVFFMATNVPTKDSTGVATLAGRKSLLKLAQRMTRGFCRAIGASSFNSWTKVTTMTGEDVRVTSRKNLNDPGEPIGVILCVVSSVWLPVSPGVLFDFLRDDAHRHEWDLMLNGDQAESIANLAKGQHRGNAVAVMPMKSKDNTWIIQDSNTNTYESILVYSPVNIAAIQSVMTGCDSSNVAILPCGFSIQADGTESRPLVLTSRQEQKNSEGGSFVTVALQVVINSPPAEKPTAASVEPVSALMSSILRNIKTSLHCEDG